MTGVTVEDGTARCGRLASAAQLAELFPPPCLCAPWSRRDLTAEVGQGGSGCGRVRTVRLQFLLWRACERLQQRLEALDAVGT